MKVLSVNVGMPQEYFWEEKTVRTGIFKKPVTGSVAVRKDNLDGDGQADRSVHGGKDKAVYAYASEHYAFWRSEFPEVVMPWGMFGENLTTIGLSEDEVRIGDRFRVGSSELVVTQPRMPCSKLGMRFGRKEIVKRFRESKKSGWYLLVAKEGAVSSGDDIDLIEREEDSFSIKEILALHGSKSADKEALQRAVNIQGLSESWRRNFLKKLGN